MCCLGYWTHNGLIILWIKPLFYNCFMYVLFHSTFQLSQACFTYTNLVKSKELDFEVVSKIITQPVVSMFHIFATPLSFSGIANDSGVLPVIFGRRNGINF